MNKINLICLDLDSVIVSLNEAICAKLNIQFVDIVPSDEEIYRIAGGRTKFWEWFGTHEFFANLKPYEWAEDLIEVVDKSGIDWIFLSKSTINDGVSSGKSQFIRENFPQYQDRLWLARGSKARMAGLGKILIDDKAINISEWRAGGGIGLHWEELRPSQTDVAVKRIEEIGILLTRGTN